MDRSIEQLVATHQLARDRVKAGLPVWERTINIKAILNRDRGNETKEHAVAVATEIAALIKSRIPAGWIDWGSDDLDEDLAIIVDNFECLRADSFDDDPSWSVLQDLNSTLSQLYDWADAKRVWLG